MECVQALIHTRGNPKTWDEYQHARVGVQLVTNALTRIIKAPLVSLKTDG